jgi:hypothetical protein
MKKLFIAVLFGTSVCNAAQHAEFGRFERDDVMPMKIFCPLWQEGYTSCLKDQVYMISLDDYKPLDHLRIVQHPSSWVQITAGLTKGWLSCERLGAVRALVNSDLKVEAKWNDQDRSWSLEIPLEEIDTALYMNIRKLKY